MNLSEMHTLIGAAIEKPAHVACARVNTRLNDKQKEHLYIRYGVHSDEGAQTLERVAHEMGITRDQARQNEEKIYRILRQHP